MFKSATTAIADAGGAKFNVFWAKVFTVTSVAPKDFAQNFPLLSPLTNMMDYQGCDKGDIRKAIQQSQNQADLEQKLLVLFKMNSFSVNDIGILNMISKTQFEKFTDNSFNYIFYYCLRVFVKNTYFNRSKMLKIMKNEENFESDHTLKANILLISVLILSQGKNFDLFEEALPFFLESFDGIWEKAFTDSPVEAFQVYLLDLLSGLTQAIQVERSHGFDHILKFVLTNFMLAISKLSGQKFEQSFIAPVRNIVGGLNVCYKSFTIEEQIKVSHIASNLLKEIVNYEKINLEEIAEIGKQTLTLYAECAKSLSADISINQFQNIVNFVTWLIKRAGEPYSKHKVILPIPAENLRTLETNYFSYAPLPPEKQLTSPPTLKLTAISLSNICQKSQNEKDLMTILAKAISENISDFDQVQNLQFLGFVTDIIFKADDQIIFDTFSTNWNYLLNENVFNEEGDAYVQNAIILIFQRMFNSADRLRVHLLKAISTFVSKNPEHLIKYFMPLIVSLLKDSDTNNFTEEFGSSHLLDIMIDIASHNMDVYDFLRRVATKDPNACFSANKFTSFMFQTLSHPYLREHSFLCIKRGILCAKNNPLHFGSVSSILIFMIHALKSYIKTNDPLGIRFVVLLQEVYTDIPMELYDHYFEIQLFEVLTEYGVEVVSEAFIHALFKLFTDVTKFSLQILSRFSRESFTIYKTLESNFHKFNFSITEDLFEMTFCKRNPQDGSLFRNPRALELLLIWSKGKDDEVQILTRLFQQCCVSFTSMTVFSKANATTHLIKRLGDFNGSNNITYALGDIISHLCGYTFTNTDLNEVVSLIKDPNYKNPQAYLEIFYNFLKRPNIQTPNAYFHFDGISTGIEPIEAPLPDTFKVSFTARIDINILKNQATLLNIKFKNDIIKVIITVKQKIILKRKNQSQVQVFEPILSVNQGIWTSFVLSISNLNLGIKNDTKIQQFPVKPVQTRGITNAIIKIGQYNKPLTKEGLPIEISSIEFFDDDKTYLSINPLNVIGEKIVNLYPNSPSYSFIGEATPNFNVQSVVPTIASINNLIPLLGRLNENSLDPKDGMLMLQKLMLIFTWCFSKSEKLQERFATENGVQVLAGYLMDMSPDYYKTETFKSLQGLLQVLTNRQIIISFITDILFNFEFISKFDTVFNLYFTQILPKIVEENIEKFKFFEDYEYLVAGALSIDKLSMVDIVWVFIENYMKTMKPISMIIKLIALAGQQESQTARTRLLKVAKSIVFAIDVHDLQVLAIYHYILPFIKLYDDKNARDIVARMADIVPHQIQQRCALISALKINEPYLIPHINDLIKDIVLNTDDRTELKWPAFLPFVAIALKYLDEKQRTFIYNAFKTSIVQNPKDFPNFIENPSPLYWLTRLSVGVLDVENDSVNFSAPYSIIISAMSQNDFALKNFFSFCLAMQCEMKKNFMNVFKEVVNSLITKISLQNNFIVNKKDLLWAFIICFFYNTIFIENPDNFYDQDLTKDHILAHICNKIDVLNTIEKQFSKYPEIIPKFNSIIVAKYKISIDKSSNSITEMLLKMVELVGNETIEFDTKFKIHSMQLFAYIIVNFIRMKININLPSVLEKMVPLMEKCDAAISHSAASMIIKEASKRGMDCFSVEVFPLAFNDDDDSPELQLFLFEDKLVRMASSISNSTSLLATKMAVNIRMSTYLSIATENIKFEEEVKEKPQEPKEKPQRQLRRSNTKKVSDIKKQAENRRREQSMLETTKPNLIVDKIEPEKEENEQELERPDFNLEYQHLSDKIDSIFTMLDDIGKVFIQRGMTILKKSKIERNESKRKFIKLITNSAGPWSTIIGNTNKEMQAYLLNRISIDGQRTYLTRKLKINTNFEHITETQNLTYQCPATYVKVLSKYEGKIELYNLDQTIVFYGVSKELNDTKLLKVTYQQIEFIFYHDGGIILVTNAGGHHFIKMTNSNRTDLLRGITYKPKEKPRKFDFYAKCRQICGKIYQAKSGAEMYNEMKLQKRWMEKRITTYQYIIYMNYLDGRDFADIEKYPFFPTPLKLDNSRGHSYFRQPSSTTLDVKSVLSQLRNVSPYNEAFIKSQEKGIEIEENFEDKNISFIRSLGMKDFNENSSDNEIEIAPFDPNQFSSYDNDASSVSAASSLKNSLPDDEMSKISPETNETPDLIQPNDVQLITDVNSPEVNENVQNSEQEKSSSQSYESDANVKISEEINDSHVEETTTSYNFVEFKELTNNASSQPIVTEEQVVVDNPQHQSLPRVGFKIEETENSLLTRSANSPTRKSSFIGNKYVKNDYSDVPLFTQESALVPEVFTLPFLTNGFGEKSKWAAEGEVFMLSMRTALESFQFTTQAHKWFNAAFPSLLTADHPQRLEEKRQPILTPSNHSNLFSGQVMHGFVFSTNSAREIMGTKEVSELKLPPSYTAHSLIDANHSSGRVAIASMYGNTIDVVSLRRNSKESINFTDVCGGALITCINVCGKDYVIVGATDCSISVFSQKPLQLLQQTYFHSRQVLCVSSCSSSKLIISCDGTGRVVIESAAKKSFLASFNVQGFSLFSKAFIFQSGYFAVVNVEQDQRQVCVKSGNVFAPESQRKKYADGNMTCCRKVKCDGNNKVVIGFEAGTIKVYSVEKLLLMQTISSKVTSPTFCVAGNTGKILMVENGSSIVQMDV